MTRIRRPAVAGRFYPAEAPALAATVDMLLAEARARQTTAPPSSPPKALVVPHAGYVYSGPVAASAYVTLDAGREIISRVVLLGPAHHVALAGAGVSGADAFETPLGLVPVDDAGRSLVARLPGVTIDDEAHAEEHSLEVQLPFLQRCLAQFTVLPLVVGWAPPAVVAPVLEAVWDNPATLVVVSSDLSHYHPYEVAHRLDTATAAAIVAGRLEAIGPDDACGFHPLTGLLEVVRRRKLAMRLLDLRSSGDTAGPRDQVVGYGAFAAS